MLITCRPPGQALAMSVVHCGERDFDPRAAADSELNDGHLHGSIPGHDAAVTDGGGQSGFHQGEIRAADAAGPVEGHAHGAAVLSLSRQAKAGDETNGDGHSQR
jgi:hypothetical protein